MTTLEQATDLARSAATEEPLNGLLERLADVVGARANVRAVFGEPVQQGHITIVPVARVRWGFGGGGGRSDDTPTGTASGSGGGGGVAADPIGYIEIDDGAATFRPIREPYPNPAFVIAGAVAFAIVIRALARLLGR